MGEKSISCELLPDDSILETPSLVTPFLLIREPVWQRRSRDVVEKNDEEPNDDVEIVKVVDRNGQQDPIAPIDTRYRKTESYIKDTVIHSLTNNNKQHLNQQETILAIEDYYKSSASQLLCSIGISLVGEFTMEERFKKLSQKMRKGEGGLIAEFDSLKASLAQAKANNRPYKLNKHLRCHNCSFWTPFTSVLEHHLEMPHRTASNVFLCNWCEFKTKNSTQILYHNYVVHNKKRCQLEQPLQKHCCAFCPFETNSKRKHTTHVTKCERNFQCWLNMAPEESSDYPAVTAKCVTQLDIRTYESTLKGLRLSAYNPHQIKVSSTAWGMDGLPILLIPKTAQPTSSLGSAASKQTVAPSIPVSEASNPYRNPEAIIGRGSVSNDRRLIVTKQTQPASPNLMCILASKSTPRTYSNLRPTILQHPKPQSPFVNGLSVAKNTQNIVMPPANRNPLPKKTPDSSNASVATVTTPADVIEEPQHSPSSDSNDDGEGTFVICEICDAYIDNVSFFKSHMQWVHKVKIHSKVLEPLTPPLKCQKCNWRYFTDQGLERHLLGSHGLVTSNMQELADQEKDSGRCTICGVRCASKLVSHIKDVHKINLKLAQLSYKCTVCAATFCLYRHFENHVYRVHAQG